MRLNILITRTQNTHDCPYDNLPGVILQQDLYNGAHETSYIDDGFIPGRFDVLTYCKRAYVVRQSSHLGTRSDRMGNDR